MEDVITDIPPPSRFFLEDLNNFTLPSPALPSPFLLFSTPNVKKPLCPSLLIVAMSSPSLYFCHHVSSKTLIGSLILPEIPFSGNSIGPSLRDKSCNIYTLNDADNLIVIISVQYSISAERSHAVAKLLIGEQIIPERVLILDSVQSQNFRGRLSPDETYAFKLQTSLERKGLDDGFGDLSLLRGLDYFPSGSVIDGLAAALLGRCQMKMIKGTLCVSWPEFGGSVMSLVKSILLKDVLPGLEYSIDGEVEEEHSSGIPSILMDQVRANEEERVQVVLRLKELEEEDRAWPPSGWLSLSCSTLALNLLVTLIGQSLPYKPHSRSAVRVEMEPANCSSL